MNRPTLFLRMTALLVAVPIVAACSSEPTAPSADDPALEALVAGGRGGSGDGARPLLERLLGASLTRMTEEAGADAAHAARARLAPLRQAIADARAAGDRAAHRAAVLDYETAVARLVVRVLGPGVVRRVVQHATDQIARARDRLEGAHANGDDVSGALATLRLAHRALDDARTAASAGDLPGALRLAARAVDLLEG